MSYFIQRTTVTGGIPCTRYFMRATAMGPMFQTIDLAKAFDTLEEAVECIEEEELDLLDGELEVVEQ